jgi:MFS transporter, ACS family, hexuronate transporter
VGYGPLFACLAAFDLIGAALLVWLIRGQARNDFTLARA